MEEEECLEVWRFKVGVIELNRHAIIYTAEKGVFVAANGNGLEFC